MSIRITRYVGVVFMDGPLYVSDTAFFGFDNPEDGSYEAGAVGFKANGVFASSTRSSVHNIRFGFTDSVIIVYCLVGLSYVLKSESKSVKHCDITRIYCGIFLCS